MAALFSVAAVCLAALVSLLTGLFAFGAHPLTVVALQHTTPVEEAVATFSIGATLGRIALATGFILWAMSSTFAFSLLLSTMTSRPFSAMAGGIGLSLFSRALDNIPGLHAIAPWLPVTGGGSNLWTGFFTTPVQTNGLTRFLLVQAVYSAGFLLAAYWRFARADIFD